MTIVDEQLPLKETVLVHHPKLLYVVIDGMGDIPIEELGNKTPLEAAETPNMDLLAKIGKTGLMYTVERGIAPESDVAVTSILGYDPFQYHTGRGSIEAIGSDMALREGDLALRCNFATLCHENKIKDRRAGRNLADEEASNLSRSVNEGVELKSHPADFEFKNTVGHRGVLVIKSRDKKLSGNISNTDPAYKRVKGLGVAADKVELDFKDCKPLDDTEEAKISAELVNEFIHKSHSILDKHKINMFRAVTGKLKANVILTRDASSHLPKFFNLEERYGFSFACLADMPVERGIAKAAGMHLVDVPPPSKDLAEDCALRVEKLLPLIPIYDCFYVHIKGPDEPGHDGDALEKARLIASIDKNFFGRLFPKIGDEDLVFCVTADHSTPCNLEAHSDHPVPLLIAGGGTESDDVQLFSEQECSRGSLGILELGTELMPMLMRLIKGKPPSN